MNMLFHKNHSLKVSIFRRNLINWREVYLMQAIEKTLYGCRILVVKCGEKESVLSAFHSRLYVMASLSSRKSKKSEFLVQTN